MENTMFRPAMQKESSDPVSRTLLSISQNILVVVCGLFPLLFLPITFAPFGYSKLLFIVVAALAALIFFSLSVLREGEVTVRISWGLVAMWGLALVSVVTALFSGDIHDAIIGDSFSIHTAAFMCLMALVMSLMGILRGSKTSIMRLYILFIVSAFVLAIFHILRLLFGFDFLTLSVFTSSVSTPLGGWNDLALYFGLTILLALVAVEQLPLTKVGRILLYAVSVLALIVLGVVNFFAVWIVLGLVSLVMLMYSLTKNRFKGSQLSTENESDNSVTSILLSITVFVVSLVFFVGGSGIGSMVSNATGISYVEVRPSVTATFDIARNVYSESAFTGIGPNKFIDAWRQFKNPSINQTIFWSTNFESGNGYITTSFITMGVFGMFAWIAFLGLLLVSGFKMIFRSNQTDRSWNFIGISSFVASVYFWGMSIIYVPTASILILAAVCTGIFFATYTVIVPHRSYTLSAITNRNIGFVLVGVVMAVIFSSVSVLYFTGQHYVALYNFNKTVSTIEEGDSLESIEQEIISAYETSTNDVFARQIVGYQIAQMNVLLNVQEATEAQQQLFQSVAVKGISAAQTATAVDPTEPANWQLLGQLYSLLSATGIEGAYAEGKTAIQNAQKYDPQNPVLFLLEAQLESRAGNLDAAKERAEIAVSMKRNYTEALFFLSQIDIAQGDVEQAVARTQSIISLEPQNPARYYQLGILDSSLGNTDRAIAAFEQAVILDTNYANARYFLALAYAEQDRNDAALEQLRAVLGLNPENELVVALIERLESGQPLTAPQTSTQTVPVEEPEVVTDSGEQVTTNTPSDTPLVTPVNTVPSETEEAIPAATEDSTNDTEG